MKAASLQELKTELKHLSEKQLVEVCTRLARYKKENKELLTYLLFEAEDEVTFISNVKQHMDELFTEISAFNLYTAAKSLRKILRTVNKFVRFSGSKHVEAQLLLHYCHGMKESGIDWQRSTALSNLYERQVVKIRKTMSTLHEDVQYDLQLQLSELV